MCSGFHHFLPFKNGFINHYLFLPLSVFFFFWSFLSAHTYALVSSILKVPYLFHLPPYFYALLYSQTSPKCYLYLLYTISHLPWTLPCMSIWICPVSPLEWLSRLLIASHIAKSHSHVSSLDLSEASDMTHRLLFLNPLPPFCSFVISHLFVLSFSASLEFSRGSLCPFIFFFLHDLLWWFHLFQSL